MFNVYLKQYQPIVERILSNALEIPKSSIKSFVRNAI